MPFASLCILSGLSKQESGTVPQATTNPTGIDHAKKDQLIYHGGAVGWVHCWVDLAAFLLIF